MWTYIGGVNHFPKHWVTRREGIFHEAEQSISCSNCLITVVSGLQIISDNDTEITFMRGFR